MKYKKELDETTNSKIYKQVFTKAIAKQYKGCEYCSPGYGCNSRRDGTIKTWKAYRKTQWR